MGDEWPANVRQQICKLFSYKLVDFGHEASQKATMSGTGKFPNDLRRLMVARGLTQADLVRALGGDANKQTVWKLVHGKTRLSADWARRLESILKIPWHLLVDGPRISKAESFPIGQEVMADEPNNLVLEHLRAIRARQDADGGMLREMNDRLSRLEIAMSHLRRDQAFDSESVAHMNVRIDHLRSDVDRIKSRLDLRDA